MTVQADQRAARWVDGFVRGWQLEDREEWYRHFEAMLAEDGQLLQPVLPPATGRGAVRETFAMVFALVPDLRAELSSWAASGDELFLAFTMSGTTSGGQPVTWRSVDRIVLNEQGLAVLREAFFDPTPLLEAAR